MLHGQKILWTDASKSHFILLSSLHWTICVCVCVVCCCVVRYVLCRSMRHGTVRVWNIARSRLAGRPVRVEHGLFTNTDVALARDLKLYILTDRGTSSITESATPVYQVPLLHLILFSLTNHPLQCFGEMCFVVICSTGHVEITEDPRVAHCWVPLEI